MKQETANLLAIALRDLYDARQVNQIGIHHQAARLACYAMFQAAHALIFERTNRMAKTHRGVAKVFHRLALEEPSLDRSVPASLSYAYSFKETAD